jgi:uncharacterized membrane protein YqaE (UPF0057 family)
VETVYIFCTDGRWKKTVVLSQTIATRVGKTKERHTRTKTTPPDDANITILPCDKTHRQQRWQHHPQYEPPPPSPRPHTTNSPPQSTILLYFLAIWLPFIPVFLRRGCRADLFINVMLCFLGWIPGIIHAWYIISQTERNPNSMGRPDGKRY